MFGIDYTIIMLVPALILSIYAQIKVSSTVKKYSKVPINSGLKGYEIAKKVLEIKGLSLPIEETPGKLSDHYDPIKKVLRLSPEVYNGKSITSASIAAHEAGHAVQHSKKYMPLVLRTASYPIARIGSFGGPILFIAGFLFNSQSFLMYGIIFFSLSVLFYIITLPVEFDASSRAKKILFNNGFITSEEKIGVNKVLNAAALTYVAAALMALLQLLRYVMIFNSRD